MLHEEFKYVGFKSKLDSPTKIGEINALPIPQQPCPFYVSIYRFAEDVGSLSSLAGLPEATLGFADFLIIDLDHHTDLSCAHSDALSIASNLDKIGADYALFFSGGKGFHVVIPTSQFGFEPTADEGILKRMAEAIKGEAKTFDGSIYNKTRVLRYPDTWNEKGGMYKTHVFSSFEFRGWVNTVGALEKILEMASSTCHIAQNPDWPDFRLCQPLVQLYVACKEKPAYETRVVAHNDRGTLFVPEDGDWNNGFFRMARRLAKQGMNQAEVEFVLGAWNKKIASAPIPEHDIVKTVKSAYMYDVPVKEDGEHFRSVDSYLKTMPDKMAAGRIRFNTGYDFLDSYTMGFSAGQIIFIAARSGNFKTSFLSNILQRGSLLSKKKALFFSMEMSEEDLVPRLFQMCEGMTHKQVMEAMDKGYSFEKAREALQHLSIVYMSNLTTEMMMDLMEDFYKQHGDPCAIGVDYLGFFRGCSNDSTRTARQAQELKAVIGKVANCPIFCLAQVKQVYEGRNGDVELDRTCVKDSDGVLDSGDFGIGMWAKNHTFIAPEGVIEEKILYGRFYKSRRMDTEKYKPDPYFALNWNKAHMQLRDIVYVPDPPQFRQRREEK